MLEIDYGLAGSGKSKYIENIFADKLASDEKLMILVPDQHSFITERSVLEKFGMRDGSKIKVIWFNNLAREITQRYGGVKPELLDNAGKAILMSKAIESVSEELDYYKKQASRPDFIARVLNFSTEMKFSKTTTVRLKEAAEHSGSYVLQKKMAEISRITEVYDDLVNASYLNPDDVLTQVNAILQHENFFEGYTVAIDGFGFFDRQKLDIIAHIIRQSKQTYITLCTDTLVPDETQADKFESVKKTAARLIETARQIGVDVRTKCFDDLSGMAEPFRYLTKGIYTPVAESYEHAVQHVSIHACANLQSECAEAALQIKKLLMQQNLRYKDIAVIVRDEQSYMPHLKHAFDALNIPFFKDARHSVSREPLMLFCHFALKCVADHFRLEDVLSYAKNAVLGMETEEISTFENYCIIWNINGKRKWSHEFTYNPAGFTERFGDDESTVLEQVNQTRTKVMVPLLRFAKKLKGASVKVCAAALYELLEEVHAAQHMCRLSTLAQGDDIEAVREQHEVWDVLMHCLEQLVAARGEEMLDAKTILSVLDLAVSTATIGVLPQRMDEILIGSADRIRTDVPKAAFLLGVNDGVFPKGFTDTGILNDAERMSLLKEGVELGVNFKSMSLQERFFAYCAALAPSDDLYLSYHSGNLDGEALSASSLIHEVQRILPAVKIQHKTAFTAEDILSEEQGFEALAAMWSDDTPLRHSLFSILRESETYADKTALMEQNATQTQKRIENPTIALQLFGEVMAISPTQLENYSKCPFMYFCKYGLRAKPVDKAALDARTGGTLIHYVLEHMVRDMGKQGISEMSSAQMAQAAKQYTQQYLDEMNLPEEFVTDRFRYIVRKNTGIIISTLEQMAAEMKQSDFEPVDFELKVGNHAVGGYEVPLERGNVSLMGMVDRVDLMQKGDKKYYRIIDYKTGRKEFKLGEVLYGINAQMLIYLLSLSTDTGEKYGGSVPAGLLYINAIDGLVDGAHDDAKQVQKNKDRRFLMNGMVLGEEDVVYGMEHEPSGKYIPVTINRDGSFGGNVVTGAQMQKIKQKLDAVIADMGNALHSGFIDDLPLKTGNANACDYCDYKAICRNREKNREVTIPAFGEALKVLEEGGDENV